MKIVCIKNFSGSGITLHRVYQLVGDPEPGKPLSERTSQILIKDDSSLYRFYDKNLFCTLEDFRESKLLSLLDE